jgi:hypothetical protein
MGQIETWGVQLLESGGNPGFHLLLVATACACVLMANATTGVARGLRRSLPIVVEEWILRLRPGHSPEDDGRDLTDEPDGTQ